ncbi:MAG: MFS transporter [Oscillospiraceae bacterium]|nr:MFS transporter [Oscillospiraceae bacterium]
MALTSVKTAAPGKARLNYPKTILTGFGFLGTTVAWTIYDPYITKILDRLLSASPVVAAWSERLAGSSLLERFIASQGESAFAAGRFTLVPLFIGIIMTFDNIFGVVFQPLFGKLSDGCHSRWGKRRPFIFFGAPISALLFVLIPLMSTLPALMVTIILFVFVMSLWRAPVVALMPDLTPPELRSEGNAVINLMGGVGGALAMAAGTVVTVIHLAITGMTKESPGYDEFSTFPAVFAVGAALMLVGMLVLLFFVKEKDSRLLSADLLAARDDAARKAAEKEARLAEKAERKSLKLSKAERGSLFAMLGGLFFLFCSVNAVTTFFSLFAQEILHKDTAQATLLMMVLTAGSMLAAIPAGLLGKKIGRKKTIVLGFVCFLGAFAVFFGVFLALCASQDLGVSSYVSLNSADPGHPAILKILSTLDILILPVIFIAGVSNMLITVNTLPLVLEIGGLKKVGTFTGYYYTATFSAQVASPIAYGFFRMFSGTYLSLFYYAPVALLISLILILFVRHGEAIPQEVIREAEEAAG